MRYRYKSRRLRPAKALMALFLCLAAGCAGTHNEPVLPGGDDDDNGEMVELCFATGGLQTSTRAAFADGTPLRLFVYRHPQSGAVDLSAPPYRAVTGVTNGVDGDLSTVNLTGGDLTDGKLIVNSGRTYDIVVVVNGAPNAQITGIGYPNGGAIAGFTQGQDILAARQTVTVNYGTKLKNVVFTSNGADTNGNLPHLGSAVMVEARVTNDLIEKVGTGDPKKVTLAVAGMDFKQCLPKNASVSFAGLGTASAINVQGAGFNTSYTANLLADPKDITHETQSATSADGYILPYPLLTQGQFNNVIHANFRLRVNGGEVLLEANSIEVPEFKPGYRYRFIVEFDYPESESGTINLYLSVEPWQSLAWDSMMGEEDGAKQYMKVAVGSWSAVSWSNTMGGDDGGNAYMIVSVAGWRSVAWNHDMGED